MVHREQRKPRRIGVGVRIAVGVGLGDSRSRPPVPVEILGFETGNAGVGRCGVEKGVEPSRVADVQSVADGQIVKPRSTSADCQK